MEAFEAHGNDAAVKQAQIEKLTALYWDPAAVQAKRIGARSAITLGELYDSCVNHGEDGNNVDLGLKQLIEKANAKAGGTPLSGVDEKAWLKAFLRVRRAYLEKGWPDAADRVDMCSRLLESGNIGLAVPFAASCHGESFTIGGTRP